ncbi:MAG TPA: hypothetical protein DIU15_02205 [Deltaproteobacteria bacterium]|nr:hypothetical protein [Deltaproteobacteria bacterium]HCP44831.1 hypothetical protein [Deltaproteobacteria bacterium]
MRNRVSLVVENRDLGENIFLLRLRDPEMGRDMAPGRFVMLATAEGLAPLARRPFSIQRVTDDVYDILYKVVGEGTDLMSQMKPGLQVRVLGPLGNSFATPESDECAILLGGGVGIPPMVAMTDALEASGHHHWQAFLGVGSARESGCFVGFDDRYLVDGARDERVHLATMDGTLGFEGHVVAAWLDWRERAGREAGRMRLYACGPMVMLRAVAAEAARLDLPCQVSVETMMGCGVGVCMACVIENADARNPEKRATMSPYDRWLLACCKGPVFDSSAVVLDDGGLLH